MIVKMIQNLENKMELQINRLETRIEKMQEMFSQTLFFWAPKSLQMVTAVMKLKDAYSLEEKYDQPRQHIKKQRHYFANKGPSSQSYGFSSGHVEM